MLTGVSADPTFHIEGVNGITGVALNPWDRDRTTGGSSAGEGGIIAAGLAPLGLGTDTAGSLKIPCAFNGIYGFRGTPSRILQDRS